MKKFLVFLLLVCISLQTRVMKHNCVHDEQSEHLDKSVVYIDESEDFRNLQTKQQRPIKMTYDISYLETMKNTTEGVKLRDNTEKAIRIALKYFSDLLMVAPKPPGSMTFNKTLCQKYQVPEIDTKQDQKDSDLHLYVSYTNEPKQGYIAYAIACQVVDKVGPTHGLINFNQAILQTYNFDDPMVFDDLIEIVTHEITHVLGFADWMIPQWIDSKGNPHENPLVVKEIRGLNTTLLRTPEVLLHSRVYYGCSTGEGMPLENQGGKASANSHWEQTVIIDEIMNSSNSNTHAIFSRLTTALLRDTGFYTLVNSLLEEKSYYGKGEGCSFLYGECNSTREFCTAEQQQKCDFYNAGVSRCYASPFYDPKCYIQKVYNNAKCFDASTNFLNTPNRIDMLGVGFGEDSRCFISNLSKIEYNPTFEQGLCYKYECNDVNQVIVKVGDKQLTCSKNGEVLSLEGYNGTLKCPEKLNEFCGFKKICPNHCSANGYCNQGKCACLPGFTGAACDKKSN